MKKLILFFLLTYICVCNASNSEELFLQANKFYLQNKYAEAYKLYDSIKNKGSVIWYNMGNCAFKIGNYVDAIVYWSKAKKIAKMTEMNDIEYNIAVAREKLGHTQTKTLLERIDDFFNRVFMPFTLLSLQLFFLLFWFGFFVFFLKLKTLRLLVLSVFLFINLFLGVGLIAKYRLSNVAIITEKGAKLFAGPDADFHVVGTLSLADEVLIKQKSDDWYKVRGNGVVGWILADKLKTI